MSITRTTLAILGTWLLCQPLTQASTVLFSETFDGVFGAASCTTGHGHGGGDHCSRGRQLYGVPTRASGADQDWWGARFETPDNGSVSNDVGVAGTSSNAWAIVEDDAGLLLQIDTRGYADIILSFDWRTYSAYSNDRFVVGYYAGTLDSDAGGFDSARSMDLRGTGNPWNWNAASSDWVELMRGRNNYSWNSESIALNLPADSGELWIAFWLDNGEGDYGKFDNILITGTAVVPVPAAVWLFASGLGSLLLSGRRGRG